MLAGLLLAGPGFAQQRRAQKPAVRPAPPVIPTPRSVLGFEPGDDRKLVEWPVLVRYFEALAKASDRVDYRELGKTTLGAPFIALAISSPQNLKRLDYFRQVNAGLADPRVFKTSRAARDALNNGKAIVLITSSIHSTEVGGHLSPVLLAYRLATDTSAATRAILDNVILWLVPSLNPDGVTIVAKWYNRTLGTGAEGLSPPELYHHYAGHDNNRDWYAFTQVETRLTVDSLYNVWHPQVVHDIHQMGSTGARLFLPPYLDPVEPNVDPLLIDGVNVLDCLCGKAKAPDRTLFWEWREGGNTQLAAMHGDLKLVITGGNQPELFNVELDPAERREINAEHPAEVKRMKEAIEQWIATESPAAKMKKKAASTNSADE